MAVHLNLRDYPGWLADKADQFPFAASQALNDTAFDLKRDLEGRGPRDLTFRKSPRQALGIGVTRSSKRDLVAYVDSERGWLTHQTQDGTLRPKRGFEYRGNKYLLIPRAGSRKNRKGRIIGITSRAKLFVVPSNGELVVLARMSRTRVLLVGLLVKEADYADDFGWEEQSEGTVNAKMTEHFSKRLSRALKSRR